MRDFPPTFGDDAPQAVSRFRRWQGISGKTYLVSVYPIDDCPDYVDAVVMAVDAVSGDVTVAAAMRCAPCCRRPHWPVPPKPMCICSPVTARPAAPPSGTSTAGIEAEVAGSLA